MDMSALKMFLSKYGSKALQGLKTGAAKVGDVARGTGDEISGFAKENPLTAVGAAGAAGLGAGLLSGKDLEDMSIDELFQELHRRRQERDEE